jgi:hypothetical protein
MDMAKPKRKLTAAERRAKKERKKNFMTIFDNGKQKRVRRPATIEGLPVDEFIRRNADRGCAVLEFCQLCFEGRAKLGCCKYWTCILIPLCLDFIPKGFQPLAGGRA